MRFYSERKVNKPRKAKQCYWCCELCPPGEPKLVISGVWNGDFFSDSWHIECNAAREVWQTNNSDEEELLWMGEMQRGKPLSREELEVWNNRASGYFQERSGMISNAAESGMINDAIEGGAE